ncbi:MAG: hypothetical protein ACOCRO_04040 [Halanaerobiales bacterium]
MKKYLVLILLVVLLLVGVGVSAEEYQEGAWVVEVTEDPLTDELKLFIANIKDYSDALLLRYQDNTLELFAGTDYLGTDSDQNFDTVLYRFDKNDIVETYWSVGMGEEALFFEEDVHTLKEFIQKMMEHDQLVIAYWPYNEGRKSVVYSLDGFTAAITPYLEDIGLSELK